MKAKVDNGFGIGKLTGLTWGEIEGYAAEVCKADGDVTYRGEYLCTVYNDEDGGDMVDANGEHVTDTQVQDTIRDIDERSHEPAGSLSRYYARIRGAEVLNGGCLVGASSNGATIDKALDGLPAIYTDKVIVIDAMGPNRRELGPVVFTGVE